MSPTLDICTALELGTLKAAATFQDPDVQITETEDAPASLRMEEGRVVVVLEFPDRQCLARFQRRVAALKPAGRRHA